ncbi:MAG: hypothetical protein HYR66_03595 [Sphingobacteriales bacterium]|nr:hypothetical protein [Sphingobacteriales bacterium]MBI3717293.1 hypothetical protein [Sphingobacteriales bacterium]
MKKLIIPFFTFLFIATSIRVMAQDVIDEDFLEKLEENAKPLWAENNAAFSVKDVPAKWNNESAVVIGYKRSITFDKQSRGGFLTARQNNLFFFEKVHFKVKLQDKNSADEFTEIYFRYSDKADGFSAHLIKPGGEVQTVDMKDAVGVESVNEVPEFFKSFFDQTVGQERRYYKVAIPDMEVGDVLEYVANTKSKLNVTGEGLVRFDPQYEICSKKYPLMYNEIVIETDNKSYFKSLSSNGAPEFKKENADDPEFYRYVFIDKDRATEKDVNFLSDLRVYPVVKFQVVYANSEKVKGALIGEKGELKTGFTKEELCRKAWENYARTEDEVFESGGYGYITVKQSLNNAKSELKKIGAKDWPDDKYITNCYYFVRNKVVYRDYYLNDKTFAYYLASLLSERDIKSDVIISISNKVGTLDQVLFDNEIRYALRVKDKLYFNCTDHSNPGDLVASLLDNDAYIIGEPTKKGQQDIQSFKMPDASFKDNTSVMTFRVGIDANMNDLLVSRTNTYTGISKTNNISDAMRYTPYMIDDYKSYGGNSPMDKMSDKQSDEYYKSVKALKDQFAELKPDFVKQELQKEYGQKIVYRDFKLQNDGRNLKKPELNFVENFELPGMVKKAGKKFLINLTGLVGSQLQIKPKERDRKLDINMDYPRSITWDISFQMPAGYTVDGLKELNKNIDNEAGKYSCEATENNGVVQIKIQKIYKQYKMSKGKWKDVLAFVDAAYNNSFKYILLKPKS